MASQDGYVLSVVRGCQFGSNAGGLAVTEPVEDLIGALEFRPRLRRTWPQPKNWAGFVLIGRPIPCQSRHARLTVGGRLAERSQPAVMSFAAARPNDPWTAADYLHPRPS
jgi:hypothetical protein